MPYSICPTCGKKFHLLVNTNIDRWYAKFAPDKKVGETVNLDCLNCWKEKNSKGNSFSD